jgi:hypothetical protein
MYIIYIVQKFVVIDALMKNEMKNYMLILVQYDHKTEKTFS